jgi:hypothetical protein
LEHDNEGGEAVILKDMILNTKLWGIAAAATFFLMIGLGVVGQVVASRLAADPDAYRHAGIIVKSAGLFLIFGLAACVAPLMVRAVLAFQVHIGNGQVPIIAFLLRHETDIVLGFWAVWILGGLAAAPAIVRGFVLGE